MKFVKKNLAVPCFFSPLLSVWISDETLFLMFDILHESCFIMILTFLTAGSSEYDGGPGHILSLGVPRS